MTIAFITGGSRGLGRSAALELAKRGVDIIFTYQSNTEAAEKTKRDIEALGQRASHVKLDTGKTQTFDSMLIQLEKILKDEFQSSRLDYILNNAGFGHYSPISEMKEKDFDDIYNVHLKGVYFLTQKLLPLMNDGGRILNVSSGLTRFSYPGSSAYASMKGAIEVFSRYLAVELAPRKISVNCIAPGAIATDFGGGRVRDDELINTQISKSTALGRVGEASDIGPVMANLLTREMQWINGQRIEVSGGIHI